MITILVAVGAFTAIGVFIPPLLISENKLNPSRGWDACREDVKMFIKELRKTK